MKSRTTKKPFKKTFKKPFKKTFKKRRGGAYSFQTKESKMWDSIVDKFNKIKKETDISDISKFENENEQENACILTKSEYEYLKEQQQNHMNISNYSEANSYKMVFEIEKNWSPNLYKYVKLASDKRVS